MKPAPALHRRARRPSAARGASARGAKSKGDRTGAGEERGTHRARSITCAASSLLRKRSTKMMRGDHDRKTGTAGVSSSEPVPTLPSSTFATRRGTLRSPPQPGRSWSPRMSGSERDASALAARHDSSSGARRRIVVSVACAQQVAGGLVRRQQAPAERWLRSPRAACARWRVYTWCALARLSWRVAEGARFLGEARPRRHVALYSLAALRACARAHIAPHRDAQRAPGRPRSVAARAVASASRCCCAARRSARSHACATTLHAVVRHTCCATPRAIAERRDCAARRSKPSRAPLQVTAPRSRARCSSISTRSYVERPCCRALASFRALRLRKSTQRRRMA